ncbi:SUN domain-containing protein 2-like isoform X2 [Clupea harengus]|nr:SUN domain-containing protein 2-like isoform X2 [Clupea harengus]
MLLFRGDYQPLRRKALMVAGLTLLGLGFWFGIPLLFRQLSSGSVNTGSGTNLAKIQEQLTDIQKQLAEKEARWKETLLKEIGSLQSEEKITSGLKMELSNWLQEYLFTGSSSSAEGVVLWPELKVVLESMEKRLVQQLATSQDVRKTVQEALSRYNADGIGMTDYALKFSGGKVITSQYTKPYCPQSLQLCSEGPSAVIEPEVYPGKCWAFRGSYGSVTIALSQSVRITHVTMEHLPKSLSPTGQIDSAPQDFAVYGIHHVAQKQEGVFLGKFAYSQDGDPIQTFELKARYLVYSQTILCLYLFTGW